MGKSLRQAAIQAAGNVFETMFFVFLEPLEPDSAAAPPFFPEADTGWLEGRIGFQGRIRGGLRLVIPYGLANDLATNFLGLETEASEPQVVDMVQELTNMICGNLFSIFDRRQGTVLDLPLARVVQAEIGKNSGRRPPDLVVDFLAEDQPLRLEIETAVDGSGTVE